MESKIVEISDLSKRFVVRHNRTESLKQLVIGWLDFRKRESREMFWALSGIDLKVSRGEMVGIIGPNGSGKSTLLKIIAGIIPPDEGSVVVRGRVAPMIELGVGFHPDLTGDENLYLNAALYGMSRDEIRAVRDKIIAFSGLRDFIDVPIRNYSTGMYMRLGFAVAAHLNPTLLLVDEVLAVGDAAFQSKCLDRMRELKASGRSILFVSHDLDVVQRLCDRVYLIVNGTVAFVGDPKGAVEAYNQRIGKGQGEGKVGEANRRS